MDLDDHERVVPKTNIPELFGLVDENSKIFISNLKEAVAIPSTSDNPDHYKDVLKMLQFCSDILKDLGASVHVVDSTNETNSNLPPVLFSHLFVNDEYKTICVYGNIDTLTPEKSQNDKHSPFELIEENGRLYGCGISDNKAPLFCWFNALKIYKKTKHEIPVNIKFVIEGTSEAYSESLYNAIRNEQDFFSNVEYICLTIDKRINETPCLKYGYRGLCHFSLTVTAGDKRVHGGTYGGAFNQPLLDAFKIVGSLVDKHGKIIVPDVLNDVKPITEMDEKLCKKEFCCIESLKKDSGVALDHKEIPSRIIMHKTRLPCLSANSFNIKSSTADKNDCSSIPNTIEALFSVRLVLNQKVNRVFELFRIYIDKTWNQYKSANKYELKMKIGFEPWQEDPLSSHYKAADAAIKTVYKMSPIYLAEGSTLPAASIFGKLCSASNMIVMPISGHDDSHHSKCESISIDNYIKGVKLVIAYMCEIYNINYT